MTEKPMSSAKPYLIRAIYEWIVDNNCTPYIHVDTTVTNVEVPVNYIQNNTITLDISTVAALELLIDNRAITFKAGFGGVPHELYIPISAVRAIYAPENGQGMDFPKDEFLEDELFEEKMSPSSKKAPSKFTIIDGDK